MNKKDQKQYIEETECLKAQIKTLDKTALDLKHEELIIQDALEYAESIVNTVREPLLILDADLRVITASRAFYRIFKVKPEETEKQSIYDLGNRQWNIPKLRELLEKILPQNTTFDNFEVVHEFPVIGKRIMLLNAREVYGKEKKSKKILLAIEDITERKKIEAALKESEEKYRSLTETSPDCIKLFNLEGKLLFINQGGLKEHRLKSSEQVNQFDFIIDIVEEDREKFRIAFKKAVSGEMSSVNIRHTYEGSILKECQEKVVPVRGANDKITYVLVVSRDITELRHLEKMKDLLSQMIIHDLNNPLAVISLNVQQLEMKLHSALFDNQKLSFYLTLYNIQEMKDMISNLLDISKMEEGKIALRYEEIHLGAMFKEITDAMKILAQRDEKVISVRTPPDLPSLHADRDLLKRVISNLIVNALKFAPFASTIEIAARYNKDSKEVVVSVKDQGKGILKKYLQLVFEKFAQVESTGEEKRAGKGLGLTFCKMAVEAHGGRIWAESEVGKKSTFYFTVPAKA